MDTLPDLRRENKNKGIWGYGACEIPVILPQVQKRDMHRRGTIQDGTKQMSRTL